MKKEEINSKFDTVKYIFLKNNPKFKICSGPHPSPYTSWVCETCLENNGYNKASSQLDEILKSLVSNEEWEKICGSIGTEAD